MIMLHALYDTRHKKLNILYKIKREKYRKKNLR